MKRCYVEIAPNGDVRAWHRMEESCVSAHQVNTGNKLKEITDGPQQTELYFLHHHYRCVDGEIVRKNADEISAIEISRRVTQPSGPTEMSQMLELMREMVDLQKKVLGRLDGE